jgi:hypothetical protein
MLQLHNLAYSEQSNILRNPPITPQSMQKIQALPGHLSTQHPPLLIPLLLSAVPKHEEPDAADQPAAAGGGCHAGGGGRQC